MSLNIQHLSTWFFLLYMIVFYMLGLELPLTPGFLLFVFCILVFWCYQVAITVYIIIVQNVVNVNSIFSN